MFGKFPWCYFSFGGGVQSSAIYLVLMHEPLKLLDAMNEYPDKVFFADTGAELQATYRTLEYMQSFNSKTYAIEVVSNGSIIEREYSSGDYNALYPFFIKQLDGSISMAKRQCTSEYKIRALTKAARQAFGYRNRPIRENTISCWLGISTDESRRAQPSKENGFINRFPLIELGMSRDDCIEYCKKYNWQPIKSRCYLCPYQSDANWLEMKVKYPEEFEKACLQDERIRDTLTSKCYLHRSGIPLREVKFKGEDDVNGFTWECQGLCGV